MSEFKGDVGQNVFGNVTEAPRLHNVVTLNMGKDKPELPVITDFQRERISILVKNLVSITGDTTLDVYKIILTDFGIEKIRELSRDRYKEVVATLDKWIFDAKDAARTTTPENVIESIAIIPPVDLIGCLACIEKSTHYVRLLRTARAQLIALVACLGLCGWLLYLMPPAREGVSTNQTDMNCQFDGKAFTVGSATKIPVLGMRECVTGVDGAHWNVIQPMRTR